MGRIITKSTGENKKGTVSIENLQDFCFFLYLIATTAHQTGEGFDAIFIRAAFILFFGVSVLQMIITRYFRWNSITAWFLTFLGFGFISCWWASSVTDAMFYNNTFIQMVGCIICLSNRIKSRDDIDTCLKLIVYSMVYSALILAIKTPFEDWGTERIGSALGLHANDIGMRFAIGVIVALYLAFSKKMYFNYAFVVIFSAIAMFSGSRKGTLMCIIAVVIYPLLTYAKSKTGNDFAKLLFQIVFAIVALFVIYRIIVSVDVFYDVVGFRLEAMVDSFKGDKSADSSMAERQFFIDKAKLLFKEHPVLGYGMNNFKTFMVEINYSHQAYSHNNYLELLSTLGLVGFSIYYSMIAYMLVGTVRFMFKGKSDFNRDALLFLILVIVCFISFWCVNYQNEYYIIVYVLIYMNIKLHIKDLKDEKSIKSIKRA